VKTTGRKQVASGDEWLTPAEIAAELKVSPSTVYYWRQVGKGPRTTRLPNGKLRVRRSVLEEWLRSGEGDAA
jgi:predicted site-specific integrase-resolvase